LKAYEPKIEGGDTTGYRVRVQVPGVTNSAFFVVKEDGQYKVLDSNEKPNAVGLEALDRIKSGDLAGAKTLLDWLREDAHLEGGDDPLAGAPFPRLWTRGAAADARKMKLAAASLLLGDKPSTAQSVAIYEEAMKDSTSDREKTNIDLALLRGYAVLDNYAGMLEVSKALLKEEPESRTVFYSLCGALMGLRRFDEADAAVAERLKLLDNDADALRMKMQIESNRGDFAAARAAGRKMADLGKDDAEVWNEIGWFALFTGKVEDADIAAAIKATQLARDNPHILHTLACLYAETGKTKEARDLLLRSMDDLSLDEPNDDYWYAFGRIAEQYGERDIAIADYRRLEKPKEPLAMVASSYVLAQDRLKAMKAASN
jgi:Flp pilus assembly protein TadD